MISFNFAPKGWALCNGQILAISQNQALFSLLGTFYGGDGRINFALPNLQGRTPIYQGQGFVVGNTGGTTAETLNLNQAGHSHLVNASTAANDPSPSGNYPGTYGSNSLYASTVNTALNAADIGQAGGSQPHNNMQP